MDLLTLSFALTLAAQHYPAVKHDSRRGVDEPHAAQQDQDATDDFHDGDTFGLIVPVEEALHHFSGGACRDNHRAMAHAIRSDTP